MTPKEKAEELVEKFECYVDYQGDNWSTEIDTMLINAKKCALIAVSEIIKALRKNLPEIGLGKGYWHSVKQEINKL